MNSSKRRFAQTLIIASLLFSTTSVPAFMPTAVAIAASQLGDMSKFRTIVLDVKSFTDRGDLGAAKMRVKDLETTWDEAEAGLKPRAASDWHVIDKAIDRVLSALRAHNPDRTECSNAVNDLLIAFDNMTGPSK